MPVYLEQPYQSRTGADPGQRFPFTIPPPGATGIWGEVCPPLRPHPRTASDNKLPYSEQFNLTIQREIARTTVLTVGYVGLRGRHLLNEVELNPGNAAKCLQLVAPLVPAGQECGQYGEVMI